MSEQEDRSSSVAGAAQRLPDNDRMDERIVETSGFLTDEQYQRSPELRKHWEQAGMEDVMRLIEREGLVVLDAPVGRWTEEKQDDDDGLGHYWRYRVRAHAVPRTTHNADQQAGEQRG